MDSIRIGILGAARIAPAAIIEPARRRDDTVIAAVAARDVQRARAYAAEHGIAAVSATYEDLVERDDIDLVYVALPPDVHCHWTLRALAAGKAVLCEKPIGVNADEARKMVAAADEAGLPLIEAFHYRFHELMLTAVALMREGVLGTLLQAEAVVDYPIPRRPGELRWSAERGGGALLDLGCYGLHALRTLLNCEPTVASACVRRVDGVDAQTTAELRFGEVAAKVSTCMDNDQPRLEVTVTGTDGTLAMRGFVLPHRSGEISLTTGGETRIIAVDRTCTSYDAQLDHVIRVLRGLEAPLTGGQAAISNMKVIDAIFAAAR